jgi:glycosyltransferase involved in cell wall biosynthesis
MKRAFSIVCVSSEDWDAQLPTNRQQIMLRAAERGHQVLFLETSEFLGKHLWRLVRRPRRSLLRRLVGGEPVVPGVTVRKALNVLPWGQRYRIAGRVNGAVTRALVRRVARALPEPVVLWVYDPCAADLSGRCHEAFSVYDCVDDYVEQVGPDERRRAVVAAGDEKAAAGARLVFATTRPLFDRQSRRNARTYLAPNAADFERFAPATDRSLAAAETADLRRPVLGFVGNIVPEKVDLDLLESLARARSDWTFLLVGPATPRLAERVSGLSRLANVRWVGPKPYSELPPYVAAFDVGLIPYQLNPYTRSCFPLKVFEYLAAGKPVVASGVPELAGMEPDVVLCSSAAEFTAGIEAALAHTGEEDRARRRALAAENTLDGRADRLLGLVAEELA